MSAKWINAQLAGIAEAGREAIEHGVAVAVVLEGRELEPEHRTQEVEAQGGIITEQGDDTLM